MCLIRCAQATAGFPSLRDNFSLPHWGFYPHLEWVKLTVSDIRRAVQAALAEDIGPGDVTSLATIPASSQSRALMRAREPLVVAGLDLAVAAFRELSRGMKIKRLAGDGQAVAGGAVLLEITGATRAVLGAERVALNFVQRLSGVATSTARFVAAVHGTKARILDTRKTTPGWRLMEKYAVACGGGKNHRLGLYDMVLIKDNHLAALRSLPVEVEADTLAQVAQAVAAGADIILLDNMNPAQLRRAVKLVAARAQTEASGGVTLKTVAAIARSGVDFISVGAITHSARAVDIGLDFPA
jgi:nicotinate-nucleotide pyrophosphorylase (carboxylating)